MKNEFVPYDIALAMKELGFDEPCFYVWNIDTKELFSSNSTDINGQPTNLDLIQPWYMHDVSITAPLYQQAFRWFREEYNLQAEVLWRGDMGCFCYKTGYFKYGSHSFSEQDYKTYEEAELACLRKLIEIVNQNKNEK